MIFEASKLRQILDLIHHEWEYLVNLEISTTEEYLTIAVNYGDLYYISYVINISNEVNNEPNFYIVLSNEALDKLSQISTFWPKSSVSILSKGDHISIDIVGHGQLLREKPVYVECVFQPAINDYIINAPSMKYNCSVNSKNLKQMLEFCNCSEGITISVNDKVSAGDAAGGARDRETATGGGNLSITNTNSSLATQVQLEELVTKPSDKIKLSAEANKLVISFLSKLVSRFNLVYLLFIEPESAFSIHVKLDDLTYAQIYTIHD